MNPHFPSLSSLRRLPRPIRPAPPTSPRGERGSFSSARCPRGTHRAAGWAPQLPAGCVLRQAVLDGTVSGSGRLPVKTVRARVYGLGLGTLRGMAPAAFTPRPVRAGEPLQAALTVEDREIRSGHAAYVPPPGCAGRAGFASRDCAAGQRMSPAPRWHLGNQ